MFPTSFKAVGNNIKNEKCGDFTGKITKVFQAHFENGEFAEGASDPEIVKGRKNQILRQQKENKPINPTLIGIIQIEVEGEPGNFSDYLHFNVKDPDGSSNRLVGHVKELSRALGETVALDDEKDNEWVYSVIKPENLVGKTVKFNQSRDSRGLNITYLA